VVLPSITGLVIVSVAMESSGKLVTSMLTTGVQTSKAGRRGGQGPGWVIESVVVNTFVAAVRREGLAPASQRSLS